MTIEELKKAMEDKIEEIKSNQSFITPEQAKSMFAEEAKKYDQTETLNKLVEASKAQGELIEKMKGAANTPEDSFTKAFNENKEKFAEAAKGNFNKFEIEMKAINASSFTNFTAGFENPYIAEIVKGKPFLLEILKNAIPVPANNRGAISYVEEKTFTSNAASVSENDEPSEDVNEFEEKTLTSAKIKAKIKVSTDQLYDVNFLRAMVEKNLIKSWLLKVHNLLLNGTGAGTDPYGVLYYATAFDAAAFVAQTGGTVDPWLLDLINAMQLKVTVDGKNEYEPNFTFLRNSLLHQLKTKKNLMGDYMNLNWALGAPMSMSGMQILGNELSGSNQIVLGDFSKAQLYMWDGMTLDVYQEKDDRSKDLVTLMVKGRMNLVVPTNDRGAIVKSTDALTDIANIAYVGA